MAAYRRGSIKLLFRGDPTLKGYWSFDNENPIDESGNARNLTLVGTKMIKQPGRFGPGYSSQTANTDSGLKYAGEVPGSDGNAATILCWFKPNATPPTANEYRMIFNWVYPNTLAQVGLGFIYAGDGTNVTVKFFRLRQGVAWDIAYYTITLPLTTFSFLALTYDGATVRGYLNGKYVASAASTGAGNLNQEVGVEFLGRILYTPPDSFIDGQVDEAAIFTRIFSPAEISAYYNWTMTQKSKLFTSSFWTPPFVSKIFMPVYDQVSFIGRISMWAKDQRNFIGRITLFAKDIRNFTGKTALFAFEILGLAAAAAKIKAVVKDIRVRFRVKQ